MRRIFAGDVHSYHVPGQPTHTHVELEGVIDFDWRTMTATATYTFDKPGKVAIDTRDLQIREVSGGDDPIDFKIDSAVAILGSRLSFEVPAGRKVKIHYRTSPNASVLQWLKPEQTGGEFPFLYSQSEPHHARALFPCQDTPAVKFTYVVTLKAPMELLALASGNRRDRHENGDATATTRSEMTYPLPAYLLAIVVGRLEYHAYSENCGVYAEPHLIVAAAEEFASMSEMMVVGEELFGPYPFGSFDVLVLPKSFPYGGMENQGLVTLNPLVVTGDKSGLGVVRHELAHSWAGNLVTNFSWRDFWLNEGLTTWADGRMNEAMEGPERAELYRSNLGRACVRDMDRWFNQGKPYKTALAIDVSGTDPDDNFSTIPYFKGSMFFRLLEKTIGRDVFDAFIRKYIGTFQYQSLTTAQFLAYAVEHLPSGTLEKVRAWEWVYESGMPDNCPKIESPLIDEVVSHVDVTTIPEQENGQRWIPAQWGLYCELLKRPVERQFLLDLDTRFGLREGKNPGLRHKFALLAIESGYGDLVYPIVEQLLTTYGSIPMVRQLYGAMCKTPEGIEWAKKIFAKARAGYHSISLNMALSAMRDAGVEVE